MPSEYIDPATGQPYLNPTVYATGPSVNQTETINKILGNPNNLETLRLYEIALNDNAYRATQGLPPNGLTHYDIYHGAEIRNLLTDAGWDSYDAADAGYSVAFSGQGNASGPRTMKAYDAANASGMTESQLLTEWNNQGQPEEGAYYDALLGISTIKHQVITDQYGSYDNWVAQGSPIYDLTQSGIPGTADQAPGSLSSEAPIFALPYEESTWDWTKYYGPDGNPLTQAQKDQMAADEAAANLPPAVPPATNVPPPAPLPPNTGSTDRLGAPVPQPVVTPPSADTRRPAFANGVNLAARYRAHGYNTREEAVASGRGVLGRGNTPAADSQIPAPPVPPVAQPPATNVPPAGITRPPAFLGPPTPAPAVTRPPAFSTAAADEPKPGVITNGAPVPQPVVTPPATDRPRNTQLGPPLSRPPVFTSPPITSTYDNASPASQLSNQAQSGQLSTSIINPPKNTNTAATAYNTQLNSQQSGFSGNRKQFPYSGR